MNSLLKAMKEENVKHFTRKVSWDYENINFDFEKLIRILAKHNKLTIINFSKRERDGFFLSSSNSGQINVTFSYFDLQDYWKFTEELESIVR